MLENKPKNDKVHIGINNTVLIEPNNSPVYNRTESETELKGNNNTFIIFGRDRPGSPESGYGGAGHGKCGAIDIVVGRLSSLDSSNFTGPVNPNVGADAARIYLSQKADIDNYYRLVDGVSQPSIGRSAIAIKADAIRLVARETFKIVTKTDDITSTKDSPLSNVGVQLIANNDDTNMQPMVMGNNLVDAFTRLTSRVEELRGIMKTFMKIQRKFNKEITNHSHLSPWRGKPVSKSPELTISGKQIEMQMYFKVDQAINVSVNNMESFKIEFLLPTSKKYINSKYHFLN